MIDLDRFKQAQDGGEPDFAQALTELRGGRKASHWIWYVFPQLRGLGRSPLAAQLGLDGAQEAAAYLRDPVLVERLAAATRAVRAHVTAAGDGRRQVVDVMGSDIDAAKLVSSLTLFGPLARAAHAINPGPLLARLADDAEAILQVAAQQGYPRCAFTEARLPARPLP